MNHMIPAAMMLVAVLILSICTLMLTINVLYRKLPDFWLLMIYRAIVAGGSLGLAGALLSLIS